jgi:ubiquinone/menaquinone biosynthesis C-methylase UbiE
MSARTNPFSTASRNTPDAGLAFDSLADTYDEAFTETKIGSAQRQAVWRVLSHCFKTGDSLLEMNCGTGIDAVFLAKRGLTVMACDASSQMIAIADRHSRMDGSRLPVVFCHLPTENLDQLEPSVSFDGAFSNFSGMNCVEDLASVAASLATLLRPQAQLVLCCSTRYCLIETVYYLLRGQPRKALRRWSGLSIVHLGTGNFPVYYPTLRRIQRQFSPYFKLCAYKGIGVAIPPSYLNTWIERRPRFFRMLCRLEPVLARLPLLRVTGDHMLLRFEKVS